MNPTRLRHPLRQAKEWSTRRRGQKPPRQAPERIRMAARWCIVSAVASIIVGFVTRWNLPTYKGDAYTEIVERITSLYGAVAWLAAGGSARVGRGAEGARRHPRRVAAAPNRG